MDDNSSMSPSTAYDRAKANPEEASDAIQTLFDYVEEGTDARSAAGWLESIAEDVPEALEGWTDRFETALETADDASVRRKLAGTVNELLEQQAIPLGDAGKALTEATRIREEEHWDDRPKREFSVIQEGLIGWVELNAMDEMVPEIVVERAVSIAALGHVNTLFRVIDLLQAAVESESPRTEMAFEGIVNLSKADDQTLTSKATLAVANLVLSGDVPNEDAAREVIAENADVVREKHPIIEEVPQDHPRVKEAREKQQLVEQAREKLSA